MHRILQTTDDTRLWNYGQCDLLKMSQCAGSEPAGRIHSQPATPPSAAQSAVTSITVRNARSNAAIAPSVTPACPANTHSTLRWRARAAARQDGVKSLRII